MNRPCDTLKGYTEARFLTEVVQAATLLGWRVYHTHDSRRSDPGFPDLCMTNGRMVLFAELKTQRGRASREQQRWLSDLQRVASIDGSRVRAYLWRPADWDDLLAVLKRGG